jgi:hypothetical protein
MLSYPIIFWTWLRLVPFDALLLLLVLLLLLLLLLPLFLISKLLPSGVFPIEPAPLELESTQPNPT